jgi:hypothetical protein
VITPGAAGTAGTAGSLSGVVTVLQPDVTARDMAIINARNEYKREFLKIDTSI